jgi:hypothetical protein
VASGEKARREAFTPPVTSLVFKEIVLQEELLLLCNCPQTTEEKWLPPSSPGRPRLQRLLGAFWATYMELLGTYSCWQGLQSFVTKSEARLLLLATSRAAEMLLFLFLEYFYYYGLATFYVVLLQLRSIVVLESRDPS